MLLCLSGSKPCHTSPARVLRTTLSLAAQHLGPLSWDTSRYASGTYVYLIFSPRNHYVYIGETSTPGREHQHVLASRHPHPNPNVHQVMALPGSASLLFLSLRLWTDTSLS